MACEFAVIYSARPGPRTVESGVGEQLKRSVEEQDSQSDVCLFVIMQADRDFCIAISSGPEFLGNAELGPYRDVRKRP